MARNLVIVESPAKAKTIEGYLGKDFTVKSSFGHVRDLNKKGLAIDLENNFKPDYVVSSDKKQVIAELKKLTKAAEVVWLATDEDREGEAISWHLFETLGLDKKETKRITFNEITKTAIQAAIEKPRKINQELVNAQQARRVLDRLVGFELSPVLWRKVRPSLSAGRVQSVAVRLIVEREKEIENFDSKSFYKVNGWFTSAKGQFRADVSRQLESEKEVENLLNECKGANFIVESVEKKPFERKPTAPFTTSTLQQEASLKLGFSVSRTMTVAQKLYESGKITYMRTDSVNLSQTALDASKKEIIEAFGKEYSNPMKFKTKSSGAQEAHEAIRPTDFGLHTFSGDKDEVRLYELIWKKAISSQMSNAKLERTTIKVSAPGVSEEFTAKGEVIQFDGFLKVYIESSTDENDEDEDSGLLPNVSKDDKLEKNKVIATQRFSRPPARYVEASLVKQLEALGIGRPSTYAPTISTIQKRGYVEKSQRDGVERAYSKWTLTGSDVSREELSEITGRDTNKLVPTDIGVVVTEFLVEHFAKILDYHFTAKVEEEFDDIASGSLDWTKMIQSFYKPFHENVENTIENSDRATGERELGIHPASGRKIIARIGRFGPMIQVGDEKEDGEKAQFASLRKNQSINSITLEEALELFKLPRVLGESDEQQVKANVGRYGPYVQLGKIFASLTEEDDPMTVTLERALELIQAKISEDQNKIIKVFPENGDVQLLNGRYGAYLKIGRNNFRLPKGKDANELSLADCLEIAESQSTKKKK